MFECMRIRLLLVISSVFLLVLLSSSLVLMGGYQDGDQPISQDGTVNVDKEATSPDDTHTAEMSMWKGVPVKGVGVQYHTFKSKLAHATASYHIYLPPDYEKDADRRFPVVYWLHGSGGGERGIPQLSRLFNRAIQAGESPAMIVVFPNGLPHGMWCDWADGSTPVESILVKELIPLIDGQYRTVATRKGRMVEGFSMGGYGAARIGFKYCDLFSGISILGGGPLQLDFTQTPRASPRAREHILQAVYGGDLANFRAVSPWQLATENANALISSTLIRQVVGDEDETLPANKALHDHLTELEIPHEFVILPGVKHNPLAVMKARSDVWWSFYERVFNGE